MDHRKMTGLKSDQTLKISYSYNSRNTSSGNLHGVGSVYIDRNVEEDDEWYEEIDIRSRKLSFQLNHPSFLRCYGYDGLDNVGGSRSGNAIYEDYTESLVAFIDRPQPSFIQKFTVPALNCAEQKKLVYKCISDVYKQIFEDMVDSLLYLHNEKGLSLLELELERNFVVKDSRVKLYRLRFNESTNSKSKVNDFKLLLKVLYDVVRRVFRMESIDEDFMKKHLPVDFVELLDCLNKRSKGDEVLIKHHLGLLKSSERIEVIKKFRSKGFQLWSKREKLYEKVFTNMDHGGKCEDWEKKLKGSNREYDLIKACYDANKNGYSHTDSASRNKNSITFSRNIAAHINSKDIKEKYNNNRAFSDYEVDCIIMAAYGKQLVSFQREASRLQILQDLICEDISDT